MDAGMESRRAATRTDGRETPEAEVRRGEPESGQVFQVREAVTVRQGRRRRREEEETPGAAFQVREAVTVKEPPPHWADLPPAAPAVSREETTSWPGQPHNRED